MKNTAATPKTIQSRNIHQFYAERLRCAPAALRLANYTVLVTASRKILLYSTLRVLLFVVPFVALMLLGIWWWISAGAAAIIAFCISYLFLTEQRNGVAEVVAGWRNGDNTKDAESDLENESLDRVEQDTER